MVDIQPRSLLKVGFRDAYNSRLVDPRPFSDLSIRRGDQDSHTSW